MKIGMLPRQDAEMINNSGLGDVRWSSNIYHFLQSQGYNIEYIPHTEAHVCDLYLDVHLREQCVEVAAARHIHLSFYSQDIDRHPGLRLCANGNKTIIGTAYRRTFEEDKHKTEYLIPVFAPIPYLDEFRPQYFVPGAQRKEITWAIRRCYENDAQKQYTENLLRALLRLNQRADFMINFIDRDQVAQAKHLITHFTYLRSYGRISWQEVLEIQARTKLNLYHNDLSGASTNEAMFCGAVPVLPKDNMFWYVPEGTESPKTENELYAVLETLWFDEREYNRHWEHYQDVFSDHRLPKLLHNWQETLDAVMEIR